MKQFTIFLLCTCLMSMALQAQTCLPDSTLKDSSAGVYPKPVTPTNPNGGIQKKACINKAYEFVFTVVVPDTVQIPILPTPLPLEKVAIDTSNAISNLPIGIGYSCNPPNCIFKKNEFGCLILHGIPTNDNSPGDFKPVIKLKLTVNVGVPFDYTTEYPGAAFPGEYLLTLLSEKDCASSSIDTDSESFGWYPNPNSLDELRTHGQPEEVQLFDQHQRLIYSSTEAHLLQTIPMGSLPAGIYFVRWIENHQTHLQKIIRL